MPNIRKPTSVHRLQGTYRPSRHNERTNEPICANPLGKPPSELNKVEKKYFNQIANESITGVLGEADRIAVSLAAKLMALIHSPEGATAAQTAQLIKLLSQFGMTPADRSKIDIPKPKSTEPNPWDDF